MEIYLAEFFRERVEVSDKKSSKFSFGKIPTRLETKKELLSRMNKFLEGRKIVNIETLPYFETTNFAYSKNHVIRVWYERDPKDNVEPPSVRWDAED